MYFLYQSHSEKSAGKKSTEILEKAQSLSTKPNRGRKEANLAFLNKNHRFLVYAITRRRTVKIIYFVDESIKTVYVTDFFATEMNPSRIHLRD
jgi:type IV secretory pathway VirB9-like protein